MGVQPFEDRPFRGGHEVLRQHVVDHADRGGRQQIAPVRLRLPQAGGEPAVSQRERTGERVGPRQVLAGPVAHGDRAAVGADEPVVLAPVVLHVSLFPLLGRMAGQLAGGRHAEGMLDTAIRIRAGRRRPAIRADRETVSARLLSRTAAQHAQVVVVGVVLHHQDQEPARRRPDHRRVAVMTRARDDEL